jgi:hypothetical protein
VNVNSSARSWPPLSGKQVSGKQAR